MSTHKSHEDRQELIESHLSLVNKIAENVYRAVKGHVSLEELRALGAEGLVQAARRYDDSRGASFATFAGYRIRGAILDGIGRIAPVSRSVYRQLRSESIEDIAGAADHAATCALRLESREVPTPEEELHRAQMRDLLERAIAELPADKQTLIRACYFEHRTLESAGRSIGISKSWASRLHQRALADLRRSLESATARGASLVQAASRPQGQRAHAS